MRQHLRGVGTAGPGGALEREDIAAGSPVLLIGFGAGLTFAGPGGEVPVRRVSEGGQTPVRRVSEARSPSSAGTSALSGTALFSSTSPFPGTRVAPRRERVAASA